MIETITDKFDHLVHDLERARIESERRAVVGEYIGVGATAQLVDKDGHGQRSISVYASDVPMGIQVDFFEDGRTLMEARSIYERRDKEVIVHRASPEGISVPSLMQTREFGKRGLNLIGSDPAVVTRKEMTFLDDVLRHAVSQTATGRLAYDNQLLIYFLKKAPVFLCVRSISVCLCTETQQTCGYGIATTILPLMDVNG